MGLFSRKNQAKNSTDLTAIPESEDATDTQTETGKSAAVKSAESSGKVKAETGKAAKQPKGLPNGPLDSSQINDDKMTEYADSGAFLASKIAGLAIQPESLLGERSFRSLAVQFGKAAVELLAVAAPKSQRLWGDLRKEVRGDTAKQGNTCEERHESLGEELLVQLAVQAPNGQRGHVQMRHCGVDDPNWFVRLVFDGAVSKDDSGMRMPEEAVKILVVVRGTWLMTPRSIIPVVLPDELTQQLAQIQQGQQV